MGTKEGISLRIVYIWVFPPLQQRHLAAEIGNYFCYCRPSSIKPSFKYPKKVLSPRPDSNPGPSDYEAAVLLTELHCQTVNSHVNWVLYNKDAILDYFLACFHVLQFSKSQSQSHFPVTVPLPSPVPYFSPKKN